MRSVFLISAVLLHMSWCYALPAPSWYPNYYNYFPGFINRYKIEDVTKPDTDKISGLSDAVDSKPGEPGKYYSSVSHTSIVTGPDGVMHKEGETVVNNNGEITKFKY